MCNVVNRPGNSVYFGSQAPSQKKVQEPKKKEEKRGERETKEKRGEEESKYGMKKVKRDQGKRKRAPVTPNQTKLLEPKKPGREKEKRKTRKVLEQKKREDKRGMSPKISHN